jgi:hypothetical protein
MKRTVSLIGDSQKPPTSHALNGGACRAPVSDKPAWAAGGGLLHSSAPLCQTANEVPSASPDRRAR